MRLSYHHRGGDLPLLGDAIDAFVRGVGARVADRDAVVSLAQDARLSYIELDRRVETLARGLMALGVDRGDRLAIWSTNNAEWVVLQLAAARVGAVLVTINPAYRAAELEHALRLARVQTLVLIPSFRSSDYVRMVCEVCPAAARLGPDDFVSERLPDLRRLVAYDPEDAPATAAPEKAFLPWPDVLARGETVTAARAADRARVVDRDDPVNIQFTSGTTGYPKAVVLTHHNILNNGYFVGETMRLTERDRLCVPVPFYHCFGMVVANLACLTHGAAIVIPSPHFDAGAALAAVERERCTALHGTPTMFVAELESPELGARDLSTLRTGVMGGAPCPEQLVRRVIEEIGCREILVAYGQTESSPITHLNRPEDPLDRRLSTVGTSLPHQEVKVIDPATGATVPLGENGEVCFRGYHVMRGYYGQEEATRAAIDEGGWLHSGDLGVMDGEGYLRITGRLKDMIIRGGENVYPAEIEAFYFAHPKVAEVSVFGVPDPRMGEEVAAWIRLNEGVEADGEEFRRYAKGRIAHHKIPRYVWIVEAFPLTTTGKIQKFRIREIAADWLAHEEPRDGAGGNGDSRTGEPGSAPAAR